LWGDGERLLERSQGERTTGAQVICLGLAAVLTGLASKGVVDASTNCTTNHHTKNESPDLHGRPKPSRVPDT
jgi:hypothetical protein